MGRFSKGLAKLKEVAEEVAEELDQQQAAAGDSSQAATQDDEVVIPSDIRMFSGCQDHQTSSDVSNTKNFKLRPALGPSGAGGACTNSFLLAQQEVPDQSYSELLQHMRTILKKKGYKQIPELSTSRCVNLKEEFSAEHPNGNGKKKALLIGINYVGTEGELHGCVNDVAKMKKYLKEQGYKNFLELTDDTRKKPTRKNIIEGIQWLTAGAKSGDSLFLHYSGHGGQVEDLNGDEEDGYDSTLIPIDYKTAGQIIDDDLYAMIAGTLPKGVHVTAIMDCCHSGSILDLPYTIRMDGESLRKIQAGEDVVSTYNPSFTMAVATVVGKKIWEKLGFSPDAWEQDFNEDEGGYSSEEDKKKKKKKKKYESEEDDYYSSEEDKKKKKKKKKKYSSEEESEDYYSSEEEKKKKKKDMKTKKKYSSDEDDDYSSDEDYKKKKKKDKKKKKYSSDEDDYSSDEDYKKKKKKDKKKKKKYSSEESCSEDYSSEEEKKKKKKDKKKKKKKYSDSDSD